MVQGFVLCQQTEGKSPHTIKYYQGILERFLWYAEREEWPAEAKLISEWHIRDFLGYVAEEKMRWGDGSSNCQYKVGHSTLRHYYVGVGALFNWAGREGFLNESPLAKIKVNKAKPRVIEPYTREEIRAMLEVCDLDYQQGAKFLASRNRAVILTLIDSGLRLSELAGMKLADINPQSGWIRVRGKGNKERIVRIGKLAQKALWVYLTWRSGCHSEVWLTEEEHPLTARGIQNAIRALKQRAGVATRGSVHRFRHTFALNFLKLDGNPFKPY